MAVSLNGLNIYKSGSGNSLACFQNFQYVRDGKLARGTQPNYKKGDEVHSVSKADVEYFRKVKIGCLISANHCKMKDEGKKLLGDAGIGFFHFKVVDFSAPKSQQLIKAASVIELFSRRGTTLVYCGYGQGRTGTFIAAWAMIKYLPPLGASSEDINKMCELGFLNSNFGVETREQVNAVREAVGLPPLGYTTPAPAPFAGSCSGPSGIPLPPPPATSGAVFFPSAASSFYKPPAFGSSPGFGFAPTGFAMSPPMPAFAKFSTDSSPPLSPSAPLPKMSSIGRGPSALGFPDDDNFGMS